MYRLKKEIWGQQRTCVITISTQLQEGQIRGIHQHLEKKYKVLSELQKKLQRIKPRIKLSEKQLISRLGQIIKGQFIKEILKYDLIELNNGDYSFNYYLDNDAFETIKHELLGRQIVVTNRHQWSNEDILQAYRGQSKVEYAFRNLKNPYHLAIRPQYHWTDQKIRVHFLICIIAYMLSIAVYTKVRSQTNYQHNIQHLMNDLATIRLVCVAKKKSTKLKFQLEKIPQNLKAVCKILAISDDNIRSSLDLQLPVTTP
jgi:transposase